MGLIQGVLLDVDGTLVDTNGFHAEAWRIAFEENGYTFSKEKVQSLIGMGGDHLLPKICGLEKSSAMGKKISDRCGEIYRERFAQRVEAFPGVKELIGHFKKCGLKLSIVTSGRKQDVEKVIELLGIKDSLDALVTADDVAHSKPDPDLILSGLEKLGLPAEKVLMVGDTPYDIQAAAGASVKTVAFRSGGWADPELKGAMRVYDHALDLFQNYAESPFV